MRYRSVTGSRSKKHEGGRHGVFASAFVTAVIAGILIIDAFCILCLEPPPSLLPFSSPSTF